LIGETSKENEYNDFKFLLEYAEVSASWRALYVSIIQVSWSTIPRKEKRSRVKQVVESQHKFYGKAKGYDFISDSHAP
jgi:hypothetical protein